MSDAEKFEKFGRMVFAMVEEMLVAKGATPGHHAYVERGVTLPDGRGGKHRCMVLVCSSQELVEMMKKGVEQEMPVETVHRVIQ